MTAPVTIWWVRHGPTHAKTMVGWTDLPADLGDTNRLDRLAAHLPAHAPVVSSDLLRARTTADAVLRGRPRLEDMPDLREIHFGAWEDRSFTEIEASDPDHIFAFWDQPGEIAAPQGESWNALSARVSCGVDRLCRLGHSDIVAVAHFGVILTQVQRALGVPAKQVMAHHLDNLSVTRLRLDGTWRAETINLCP